MAPQPVFRDATSGQEIRALRGHEEPVADFSPDGTRIVTASTDRTARIWDAASGQEIRNERFDELNVSTVPIKVDNFVEWNNDLVSCRIGIGPIG